MSASHCGYVRYRNKTPPPPRRSLICPLYHERLQKYLRCGYPSHFAFTTLTTSVQRTFPHQRPIPIDRITPAHHTPFFQADYRDIQISPSHQHTWRGKTRHRANAIEQNGSSHESANFHCLLPISSEN